MSELVTNHRGKPPEHNDQDNHLSWNDLENGKSNDKCHACVWLYVDYHKWAKNWRKV